RVWVSPFSGDGLPQGHRRAVALAWANLQHSRIAARALLHARHQLGEEPFGDLTVFDDRVHRPAGGDVVVLGRGDDRLDPAAQLLTLGLGRFAATVVEQRRAQLAAPRLATRR